MPGLKVRLGNGSANCKLYRRSYDTPTVLLKGRRKLLHAPAVAHIAPKVKSDGKAKADAVDSPIADPSTMQKLTNCQYGTLMVWLSKDEFRNDQRSFRRVWFCYHWRQ